MRRLIKSANQQLRTLESDLPGLLVVFITHWHLRRHVDPYAILTAMRGLDVVDVEVPVDPKEAPVFGSVRSGPKKQMTEDHNTSTSAIACATQLSEAEWGLDVFHNRFATRPLPTKALQGPHVRHWRIRTDEREWEPELN
jgi:hypothetical protein